MQHTNGHLAGDSEDYDAIAAETAKALPRAPSSAVDYSHMIAVIAAWKDVLNARLLALMALSGAMIGFAFTMYDPSPLRLWGLGIYSLLCLWPTIALYLRKG